VFNELKMPSMRYVRMYTPTSEQYSVYLEVGVSCTVLMAGVCSTVLMVGVSCTVLMWVCPVLY
jgi:hypothetical protein